MSYRFVIAGALVLSLSACGKSAETKLKNADEAAQEAREKDKEAKEAQEEAREAQSTATDEQTGASKAVREEREEYRAKLQKEVADANAKLAPPADKPRLSQEEQVRIQQRRDALNQHLNTTVHIGGDKEWPSQKKRIDADLDR